MRLLYLIPLSVAALALYLLTLSWPPSELLLALVGVGALLGPFAAALYLLLRRQMPDRMTGWIVSLIASYALVALVYFLTSAIGLPAIFYAMQLAAAGAAGAAFLKGLKGLQGWHWRDIGAMAGRWKSFNWELIALIALGLWTQARYQIPFRADPQTGGVRYVLYGDQTYFTSLSYELGRATPPRQQSVQAGAPERAYHLFPHVMTMLIARYTFQSDMLRAHLAYHYALIEVLLPLALYCIVRLISGSKPAGLLGVALLYILAVPVPPLMQNAIQYFYFTIYPHATSILEPVVFTSPQMYSGLLVLFGVLLALAVVSSRRHDRQDVGWVMVVTGAMVGALMLFRAQIFLPIAPGFCLLMAWFWARKPTRWPAIAGGVTILIFAALLVQSKSPMYLKENVDLRIGYNGLTSLKDPWMSAWMADWPGSSTVYRAMEKVIGDGVTFDWAWQVVCLVAFTVLNIIGPPLLLATIAWLVSREARRRWAIYSATIAWLVVMSLVGAACLAVGYDPYSLGGQMPLHIGWYLLPFMAVGLWWLVRPIWRRFPELRARRETWAAAAFAVVALMALQNVLREPSFLEQMLGSGPTFTRAEWAAMRFLHDSTPPDAVIIAQKHIEPAAALFGGIAGRAAYLEYTESILFRKNRVKVPSQRGRIIRAIWNTPSKETFAELLCPTPATYLVEFEDRRTHIGRLACLADSSLPLCLGSGPVFEQQDQFVTARVYRIER